MSCNSDAKIAELTKRVEALEAIVKGSYTYNWHKPQMFDITPRTSCPRCGIDLSSAIGYVCSDPLCPTGLGPITCKVGV